MTEHEQADWEISRNVAAATTTYRHLDGAVVEVTDADVARDWYLWPSHLAARLKAALAEHRARTGGG